MAIFHASIVEPCREQNGLGTGEKKDAVRRALSGACRSIRKRVSYSPSCGCYPLVNKQVDPENHQFLMETILPTPTTARVYVNLPEAMPILVRKMDVFNQWAMGKKGPNFSDKARWKSSGLVSSGRCWSGWSHRFCCIIPFWKGWN